MLNAGGQRPRAHFYCREFVMAGDPRNQPCSRTIDEVAGLLRDSWTAGALACALATIPLDAALGLAFEE
jgi:hypothetical protein